MQCTPSSESILPSVPSISVGVDIGDRLSEICVLDASGEVLQRAQVPTTQVAVRRFFETVGHARVAMEVGNQSAWIQREVSSLGHEVYVANARKLRAIWDNDSKTDRTDAHLLAEIVQIKPSLLRPIQHRGEEARNDLRLVQARATLVRARTLLVNHVRGSVKTVGERMPACDASTFHKAVDCLPDSLQPMLEPMLKQCGEVTALVRGYDKAISKRAGAEPAVAILTQVPGVGDLTALAFVATIEDPNRFPQARKVGSYLGLRPRLDQSGMSDKQLRITKAGDKYLRQLLVGSAQYILGPFGPDTDLRRWGLALAERGGKNAKKRAAVAVARKLAVLLLTLWKTGGVYEPLRRAKRTGTLGQETPVADTEVPKVEVMTRSKPEGLRSPRRTTGTRSKPPQRKLATTKKPTTNRSAANESGRSARTSGSRGIVGADPKNSKPYGATRPK